MKPQKVTRMLQIDRRMVPIGCEYREVQAEADERAVQDGMWRLDMLRKYRELAFPIRGQGQKNG
jgi:hypothetical protein